MTLRKFNFSPGPAVLPEEVLQIVSENILSYQDSGIGIMEMSHRSKAFLEIIKQAQDDLRSLLEIGDDFAIIFASGGATNQFSMVPMNLLSPGMVGDYILSGAWSEKAYKEAGKFGEVTVAGSSAESNYNKIPAEIKLSERSAYCHFTSNNTIFGTEFQSEPAVDLSKTVLVCDASSDLLHKKIDIKKYGLIYAGAQKNLGPAGVTVVIIRRDLLSRSSKSLPIMLNYNTYVEHDSLYNTPPVFAIYVFGEVLKWIKRQGGLAKIEQINREKAELLYAAIDASDFYIGHAEPGSRSLMNVTFRIRQQDLEPQFVKEAAEQGLVELKGHRSVGGLRASIYNAFPLEGVKKLVAFMREFEGKHA
ncbi:MAG: 3-phosphoserine/phosphohydroxythreonine transaminase [Deltaproteobacteria bacterium]|nr:3-phosphoserine/phosphohydroxythreonine transaminase [Deltaproteobacteria bacterium]